MDKSHAGSRSSIQGSASEGVDDLKQLEEDLAVIEIAMGKVDEGDMAGYEKLAVQLEKLDESEESKI
tara:strand:+ start:295 stop:495 length:201 start_codon:yes stop_codon:yes gene_type:complete